MGFSWETTSLPFSLSQSSPLEMSAPGNKQIVVGGGRNDWEELPGRIDGNDQQLTGQIQTETKFKINKREKKKPYIRKIFEQ